VSEVIHNESGHQNRKLSEQCDCGVFIASAGNNASDPEMWFTVMEAFFTNLRFTNSQKRYRFVISALPSCYAN
jgi:hypothetical protein